MTDNFIIGGDVQDIDKFILHMKNRFEVGKYVINESFLFDGCEVKQEQDGCTTLSMMRYVKRLASISLTTARRKQPDKRATEQEMNAYRSLAGILLFLGNAVLPQAAFVTSLMQQKLGCLLVQPLLDANEMVKEVLELDHWIRFPKCHEVKRILLSTFSDASHPRVRTYGETGVIIGLRGFRESGEDKYHVMDWTSHRQKRVSYSAYSAEILACATADDPGNYLKQTIQSLLPRIELRHEVIIESNALQDTTTTLHGGTEYRLRPTVQRIRDSFKARELNILRWIPGTI